MTFDTHASLVLSFKTIILLNIPVQTYNSKQSLQEKTASLQNVGLGLQVGKSNSHSSIGVSLKEPGEGMKVHETRPNKIRKTNITTQLKIKFKKGSYNIRDVAWDIVSKNEIRRKGENLQTLKSSNPFYYQEEEEQSIGKEGFIFNK